MQVSDFCQVRELNDLMQGFQHFAHEREWEQFHTPKNLVMAMSVEASELLEIFQWKSDEACKEFLNGGGDEKEREKIEDEIADVFLYLLRISQRLNIDPLETSRKKMIKNAQKYPVEKSKGRATKYTEL